MSDHDYQAFRLALEDATPSISMDDLGERIAAKAMIDKESTAEIVWLLAGVYAAHERIDSDLDDFIGDLCKAAQSHDDKYLEEVDDWPRTEKRLHEILSLHRSLGLSAKAFDVIRETERLYCRARILTDVRPVFLADDPADAAASVVMHSLRLAYHAGPTRKVEHFFVSIETDDLKDLNRVIERALVKDETMRSISDKAGMPSLNYTNPSTLFVVARPRAYSPAE